MITNEIFSNLKMGDLILTPFEDQLIAIFDEK